MRAVAAQVPEGIASGAYREEIERVLELAGLAELASVIVSIDEVRAGKPDLRRGDRLAEVAALLRRLHGGCRFRGNFDMFRRQRDYQAAALSRGFALPDGYTRYERHVRRIERAFAAHPVTPVACPNDPVAENLIDTPAGLRLIDYDYSGENDPARISATPGRSRISRSSSSSSSLATTSASPTRRSWPEPGSGR